MATDCNEKHDIRCAHGLSKSATLTSVYDALGSRQRDTEYCPHSFAASQEEVDFGAALVLGNELMSPDGGAAEVRNAVEVRQCFTVTIKTTMFIEKASFITCGSGTVVYGEPSRSQRL